MDRGVKASTSMTFGFLYPHYGVSAVEGQTRRSMFSNEEERPDSMQHGATIVLVQTQFSILKLSNCLKNPNKKHIFLIIPFKNVKYFRSGFQLVSGAEQSLYNQ